MTRVHVDQPLESGQELALPPEAAHHLARVLRVAPGAGVVLFNGRGGEFAATVIAVGKRELRVRLAAEHDPVERESPLDLTLMQCVSKGERMDLTIQKAVELGVRRFVPLRSERSVVRLDADRWAKKGEHWRGVIVAACEQCGRNRLPELAPVDDLDRVLAARDDVAPALRLVLAPTAQPTLSRIDRAAAVHLLVGPEGGLSPQELARAVAAGWQPLQLGPRVLRTETAGPAALAVLQARWGDLS
jgi:16S rRNA m(3)U-1498 methyltransferase (EC 2.1.1.-)